MNGFQIIIIISPVEAELKSLLQVQSDQNLKVSHGSSYLHLLKTEIMQTKDHRDTLNLKTVLFFLFFLCTVCVGVAPCGPCTLPGKMRGPSSAAGL